MNKLLILLFVSSTSFSMNKDLSDIEKEAIRSKIELTKHYEQIIHKFQYTQWHGSKENQESLFASIKNLKNKESEHEKLVQKLPQYLQREYSCKKNPSNHEEKLINHYIQLKNETLKEHIKKIPNNKSALCLRCLFCCCCCCLY